MISLFNMYLNFPLFFSMMLMGIVITVNSSSWLSAWIGMELNIICFLPMILEKNNLMSYEIIMKYFLISSVTSMIILYFTFFNYKVWMFTYSNDFSQLILLSLGMKLGSAPFHNWFISFIGNMNLSTAFWLMTLQKFPPLFLMNMCVSNYLLQFFMFISLIVGSIGGFHQTKIMNLLAYSSISHLSWMLVCISFINVFWAIYFFIYFIMLANIMFYMKMNNLMFMNMSLNMNTYTKFMFFISILSFSGFPPLLGFFPKFFIIMMLAQNKMYFIIMMLIISTMINLYFYLRLTYNMMFHTPKNTLNMNVYSYYFMFNLISLMPFTLILII